MDFELKSVEIPNGETLFYRERTGGEEKLLLVHGNMISSKHWDVLMEKLDKRYKVIAVDLRGFGYSSYSTRIEGIKDFSDDLKHFTDLIGWDRFSMVGWSTGGAVAMQYCADSPGSCERLVLLASASTRGYPYYGMGPSGTMERMSTLQEIEKDPTKTIPVQAAYDSCDGGYLKTLWNTAIYTQKQPSEEKYEEYLEDMMTQRNLADVYQALNIFNISSVHNGLTEGSGQAKEIDIPVLVLRGNLDLVITKEMADEIMEDLGSNARFVMLQECGHSPLIDDISLLTEKVESFLGEGRLNEVRK